MSLIINIETSTTACSAALGAGGRVLDKRADLSAEYSHAEKLHAFIRDLLEQNRVDKTTIEAVAVSTGPGSYTGLRIGVAAAKGLCYAWNVPLIAVPTLETMFVSMQQQQEADLYIPMIDARRMEVYMQSFQPDGKSINEVEAVVLDEKTFAVYPQKNILLAGNGSDKCAEHTANYPNIKIMPGIHPLAENMVRIAHEKLIQQQFEDLAYFEPFYLKEYQSQSGFHKKK